MNYRFLIAGAVLVAAPSAHAAFTITLDQPLQAVVLPNAHTEISFLGNATKDEQGAGGWGVSVAAAGLPSDTDYLMTLIGPQEFLDWLETPSSPTFHGTIFKIFVEPTNLIGLHDYNVGTPDNKPFLQMRYTGVTGFQYESAKMNFAVDIQAVPEPATLSVLALGGLAFLRRKRR